MNYHRLYYRLDKTVDDKYTLNNLLPVLRKNKNTIYLD